MADTEANLEAGRRGPLAARLLPSRWYYGWAIVGACAALLFVSVGVGYYGLAVYLGPLQDAHGWSNGDVSLATGLYFAVSGIAAALVGPQIDRHGSRRWMAPGLVCIGAGSIAAELFPAMTRIFDLDEVRVVARRRASAEDFCRRHEHRPARFTAMDDARQALDGADIAITLSLAETPVIESGMLSPGAFLCSMGETEEVAFGVLAEIDRFVVDDFDYATMLGDIEAWLRNGLIERAALQARVDAHIGEVVAGAKPIRENAGQRIFAIVQGMAICDLALARHALVEAEKRGLGGSLDLFG